MLSRWTSHLRTEEEKENFRRVIRGSSDVLDRLAQIVLEDLSSVDRSENNPSVYDRPNWDYRQAHKNGNRQYADQMLALVNLDQQKEENESIRSN